jgi:hypothetical protein
MAESTTSPMHVCDMCGAKVAELRRGRCWGCYASWVEGRPVGLGAACVMCNDRRREHLRMIELLRAWVPSCHNCHARVLRLDPMPASVEDIRTRLARDRRTRERRVGKADTRVYPRERRGLERRHVGAATGDDLLLLDDDILIVEELFHAEGEMVTSRPEEGVPARGEVEFRDDETRIQLAPEAR